MQHLLGDLTESRRAIRHLLRERDGGDAMAVYYAFYHPDDKTTLILSPEEITDPVDQADGYVALLEPALTCFDRW